MGNYHSRITEIWTALDEDHDGYLTKDDIKEWFCDEKFLGNSLFSPRHNGMVSMEELAQTFIEYVDTNGDDRISFDELAKYFSERDENEVEVIASTLKEGNDRTRVNVLRKVFHQLDKKHDGIIPKSEIETFFVEAQYVSKESLSYTFELLSEQGPLLKFPDFAHLFRKWKLREIRRHTEPLLEDAKMNHRAEILARHQDVAPPDVSVSLSESDITDVLNSIVNSNIKQQSELSKNS